MVGDHVSRIISEVAPVFAKVGRYWNTVEEGAVMLAWWLVRLVLNVAVLSDLLSHSLFSESDS